MQKGWRTQARKRAFGAQLKEEKDVEKGIDFMLDILDDLLGEDTVDAITAKRDVDIYDCLDLVMYISQECRPTTQNGQTATRSLSPEAHSPLPPWHRRRLKTEPHAEPESVRKEEGNERAADRKFACLFFDWRQGIPHLL